MNTAVIFRQQFLGETVEVLIEQYKHGNWEGLTDNYLHVELEDLSDQTQDWQHRLVRGTIKLSGR